LLNTNASSEAIARKDTDMKSLTLEQFLAVSDEIDRQYKDPNLYSLYYYPKGLCWQVKHDRTDITFSFETEQLAIQSVIDVDGTFEHEQGVMYA